MDRVTFIRAAVKHPNSPIIQPMAYNLFGTKVPQEVLDAGQGALETWVGRQPSRSSRPTTSVRTNAGNPLSVDVEFTVDETWAVTEYRRYSCRATIDIDPSDFVDEDGDIDDDALADYVRDQCAALKDDDRELDSANYGDCEYIECTDQDTEDAKTEAYNALEEWARENYG